MSAAIPELLRAAIASKVQNEVQPARDALARLRVCLDGYEATLVQQAEQRAVVAVLSALGQPAPDPDSKTQEGAEDLRVALVDVLSLLDKSGPVEAPVATGSSPPVLPVAVRSPRPSVPDDPTVIESACDLLEEIDDVDFKTQHPLRLAPLLQALVAECRWHMDRLSNSYALREELSAAVRFCGHVRKDKALEIFITGLGRDQIEDWERVSRESRRRLVKFDQDAGIPLKPKKTNGRNGSSKPGNGSDEKITHQWPELKSLRSMIDAGKGVILVGGGTRPEKLRVIHERFGIKAEWYETDARNARRGEDVVNRVRGGSVAAVIILTGLISHGKYQQVSDACKACRVPCTLGERGGVGSIEVALAEIERQCATGVQ